MWPTKSDFVVKAYGCTSTSARVTCTHQRHRQHHGKGQQDPASRPASRLRSGGKQHSSQHLGDSGAPDRAQPSPFVITEAVSLKAVRAVTRSVTS